MIGSLLETYLSRPLICIDSSGGMDRSQEHLFNLVIPGPVGSLSVGMFVTFSETYKTIERGLYLLKKIWTEFIGVNADFSPKVFMSDDCSAQIKALNNIFPESKVLLCQFHVANAMWKWLMSNINLDRRMEVMEKFKWLIYEKINYDSARAEFFNFNSFDKKLFKHCQTVLKKETLFCNYHTKKYDLLGVNTNNLIERSFLTISRNTWKETNVIMQST